MFNYSPKHFLLFPFTLRPQLPLSCWSQSLCRETELLWFGFGASATGLCCTSCLHCFSSACATWGWDSKWNFAGTWSCGCWASSPALRVRVRVIPPAQWRQRKKYFYCRFKMIVLPPAQAGRGGGLSFMVEELNSDRTLSGFLVEIDVCLYPLLISYQWTPAKATTSHAPGPSHLQQWTPPFPTGTHLLPGLLCANKKKPWTLQARFTRVLLSKHHLVPIPQLTCCLFRWVMWINKSGLHGSVNCPIPTAIKQLEACQLLWCLYL